MAFPTIYVLFFFMFSLSLSLSLVVSTNVTKRARRTPSLVEDASW